jgi:topoisomerase IA-like protein
MGFGGSGTPDDRAKLERMRRIVQAETTPPTTLVITADSKQIAVTADDGRAEVLILDGKRHLRLTGDGELYTTTRWVAGQLVSERRYDEGIKATRTYVVEAPAAGARRMIVTLKLEGGGRGFELPELRRVYTASPP